MMLLKFSFYFVLSYMILCIPLKERQVFDHLYQLTSPYTESLFSIIKVKGKEGLEESKKIFSNTKPSHGDKVKSRLSSIQKKSLRKEIESPSESYTNEEKELLKKILKEAQD